MLVLCGSKLPTDKLCSVQLPSSNIITSNFQCNATHLHSDADFVSFVHGSLGNPAYSTFSNTVRKGCFTSWPRFTSAIISAHPPHTIAAAKGHLNQHRQGSDSTHQLPSPTDLKLSNTDTDTLSDDLVAPEHPTSAATANYAYIPLSHTVSAELTGKFPVIADSGAQCVLTSEMDGSVHAEAMTSRHHSAYIASFTWTIVFFTSLSRPPLFPLSRQLKISSSRQIHSKAKIPDAVLSAGYA